MQIQQDNFIQKLLSLEKGKAHIPNLRKRRTLFLNKLTDARLVKYIRRGNSHAFDVLIKRHEAKLKYLLRVNLFDKSKVDDVSQDVWEMVVHHLRSRAYKETGQFAGWLRTVAFHKAMKVNRRKLYSPEFVDYDPDMHDVEDTQEEGKDLENAAKQARELISKLKGKRRQIVKMHLEEGIPFDVIAATMKISSNHVRSIFSKARQQIKEQKNIFYKRGANSKFVV